MSSGNSVLTPISLRREVHQRVREIEHFLTSVLEDPEADDDILQTAYALAGDLYLYDLADQLGQRLGIPSDIKIGMTAVQT